DKRARVKPDALRALHLDDPRARSLREGALRHHNDDHRFHTSSTFEALTDEAVHALRALSPDPRYRASALGHIAVEMLVDACVEERRPGVTARYYDAIAAIDDDVLATLARDWTSRPLPQFPLLAQRFRKARFLFQY